MRPLKVAIYYLPHTKNVSEFRRRLKNKKKLDPCAISAIVNKASFGEDILLPIQDYLRTRFQMYGGDSIVLTRDDEGYFCIDYKNYPAVFGHASAFAKTFVENIFRFLTLDVEWFYTQCEVYSIMQEKSKRLLTYLREQFGLPLHMVLTMQFSPHNNTPERWPAFTCNARWVHDGMVYFESADNFFYGWFARVEAVSKMANLMYALLVVNNKK